MLQHSVMETETNNMSRKRRAVYQALYPYFSGKQLIEAMWLWNDNYSKEGSPTMREYVAQVTENTHNRKHHREIYNSIMNNFLLSSDELVDDPMNTMLAYRSGKIDLPDSQSEPLLMKVPLNIVFNCLLLNFYNQLAEENKYQAENVIKFFSKTIHNLILDTEKSKEILKWQQRPETFLGSPFTKEEFSAILHILYVGACEFFGPQKTDHFLSSAVKTAENLPEAHHADPKQFL